MNSNCTAVESVQDGDIVNWDDYGVDKSGPVPELQIDHSATMPTSPINIMEVHNRKEVVETARGLGDTDGLAGFLLVLYILQQINT